MKTPLLSKTIFFIFITIITTTSLLLLLPVTSLGSVSTFAISYSPNSPTVCGIIAGEPKHRIQCYKEERQSIPIQPNISFESISGGRDFFCGLRSGGFSLLCWDTKNFQAKRIYNNYNTNRLTALAVGNSQVCALQANTGGALCWRFPSPDVAWRFSSITSGGGFSCGILKDVGRVKCWGNSEFGVEIQSQFGNASMISLVAGESHACGVAKNGTLICKGSNAGGQLDVPSDSLFEFSSLALGANHSCGIQRKNGLAICWGGGSKKLEYVSDITKNVSLESLVAGLDFTCGLTTENLSLICWGPGWYGGLISRNIVPLPMVIPGPCVKTSCSICGIYPNSDSLCAGSGNICKSCEVELPIPVVLPPVRQPKPPLQVIKPVASLYKARKRLLLIFGIIGSAGTFAGICTIIYCLWSGVCGLLHKKVQNPEQTPNIRANVNVNLVSTDNIGTSGQSSRLPSSVKHENSQTLKSQRSGASSKYMDRAEKFSISELMAATNNFSSENKIGGGSFGTVYKGTLVNGQEVAIKRGKTNLMMMKFQEKESAFESELVLLSRLHHKHLVELVGFCQEENERVLVYEYMSNGSLHDHLHSKNNVENSSSILNSWKMRLKIALDAARGIEYLHNYAVPPIIHRDIKSSNILLDANWIARVSDFGLSLTGPESDQESISTKAVGTIGYIDPEYYILNILTVKSDVYGLGVVLLELLTGKRAVFKEAGTGPVGVVEYARPHILAGELQSVLDNRVGVPVANEAMAVELVAYTAMHCVNSEGKERPTVTEIVTNLEKAISSL